MGHTGQRTSRIERWWVPSIVAACLLCSPVVAGDLEGSREAFERVRGELEASSFSLSTSDLPPLGEPRALRLALARPVEAHGFLKRHLMPRVSQQLERMAPIHALDFDRATWQQTELHGWFSGTANHYAERGLKRAARSYLVEETAIGPWLEGLRLGGHGNSSSAGRSRSTDYGVRVSHGRPSLEMRRSSSVGTTRFGVGLDGSLRLEFRPANSTNGRFAVGYAARESSYVLSFRHTF